MSYSGPITIYKACGWTLDSWGNGASYTLRYTEGDKSRSCFFQGDDAETFRADFDSYENPQDLFAEYWEVMEEESRNA